MYQQINILMNNLELFLSNKGTILFVLKQVLAFSISLILSFKAIPIVIKISKRKNLMDEPGERSSHIYRIPNLGGIAIFYSIGLAAPVFAYELFEQYRFLFPALVILLYIGVMDDILVMRAYKKLIAQIAISVMMVLGSDIRIRSLFGLFGVYEIDYWLSVLLSIFTFVILINSFNLIDGIDGLAGIFAIISFSIFGFSYFRLGEYNYPMVTLCIIVVGALFGFLHYNLSNQRFRKIFMGDTGSMIIGFLLVFTAMYFIDIFIREESVIDRPEYHLQTAPVIAFTILLLPIIDTLSVIIIRLLNNQSPLQADRNHIHHKLLDFGMSHKRATFIIIMYYLTVIIAVYLLRHININLLFFVALSLGFFGAYLPNLIRRIRNHPSK